MIGDFERSQVSEGLRVWNVFPSKGVRSRLYGASYNVPGRVFRGVESDPLRAVARVMEGVVDFLKEASCRATDNAGWAAGANGTYSKTIPAPANAVTARATDLLKDLSRKRADLLETSGRLDRERESMQAAIDAGRRAAQRAVHAPRNCAAVVGVAAASVLPPRRVSPDAVIAAVLSHYGVSLDEFRGSGRHPRVVRAREMCVLMFRRHTTLGYADIAREMGRTAHSTLVIAHKRALRRQAERRAEILDLDRAITGR